MSIKARKKHAIMKAKGVTKYCHLNEPNKKFDPEFGTYSCDVVIDKEQADQIKNVLRPLFEVIAQSAAMGALPTLRAATDLRAEGGQYYGPDGFMESRGHPVVVASSDRSHEVASQRRLWAASEDLTGVTFPV